MKFKKVFFAIVALALIAVVTVCGCYTESSAYNWARGYIDAYYYWDLPDDCEYKGSVKQFVKDYLDVYSAFYTKEEYDSVYSTAGGNMSGLGVSFEFVPEGVHPQGGSGILLVKVIGNSPAYKAGLRAGEFVKSGTAGTRTVQFDSAGAFSGFLDSLSAGQAFTLTTDKKSYTVAKEAYTASYCRMSTNGKDWTVSYDGDKLTVNETEGGIECLPDGAAYLRLDQFYGNAANEMGALIAKYNAESCTSLILDLRGNGGGYVDLMGDISNIYTGQLQNAYQYSCYAEYKGGQRESYYSQKTFPTEQSFPAGMKLSVLADNGTASASEALIGVLISNGVMDYSDVYVSDFSKAYLDYTGTGDKNCRTYGKGIMQTTFKHQIYGYAIKLTTAKIYWPDGRTCIHGSGLGKDTGCKTVEADWEITYADEQLAKAVALIYGGVNNTL